MTTPRLMDNCESVAAWTVLGNDTTGLGVSLNSVAGRNAIQFNKVDGAAGSVHAGIYRTLDSWNLRDTNPWDEFAWFLNVSATTDIAYAWIRLGTDSSNYMEFRFDDSDITAGRPTLCHVARHAYSDRQGTGADWSNLDYMAIGVAFDAETSALATIVIDHIMILPAGTLPSSIALTGALTAPDMAQANAAAQTWDEDSTVPLSVSLNGDLRTTITDAQIAYDAAMPTEGVAGALKANITMPTAVGTTGDAVAPSGDAYGRHEAMAHVRSSQALATTAVSPEPRATFSQAFTALTAAGSTAATDVSQYCDITWQIVIAAIDTSVDVAVEGSNDGTSWFNMNDAEVDTQYLANGTYSLRADSRAVLQTRLTMTAEAGGAAVTVTGTLFAGN